MLARRFALLLIVLVTVLLSSCTPAEIAFFRAHYQPPASTCHGAVDRYWPSSSRSWAHAIVNRESRGDASAWNPTSIAGSHASGCMQLLLPMHNDLYRAVGCDPARWRGDADCGIKAALVLYRGSGSAPWR